MSEKNQAKKAAVNRSWFWIALVFLISRLFTWAFQQPASDVADIYARYAQEQHEADRTGLSLYTYHAQVMEQQAEKARAEGRPVAEQEELQNLEYPPLALAFLRVPAWGMWLANLGEWPEATFVEGYDEAYRAVQAFVDLGLFALLIWQVQRLYPLESGQEHRQRLWGYVLPTVALWYLLFDRLDLVLALLMLLALILLFSRAHFGWSFGVLALAIHFKLVPLVLTPLFLVGSLPAGEELARSKPRLAAALALRVLGLTLLMVLILLPFYAVHGSACLGFLAYHQTRGLEFESLYGSVVLLLQRWTGPVSVVYSFKSVAFQSSLSPWLTRIAPWLAAGLLAATTLALLIHAAFLLTRNPDTSNRGSTLAQRFPQLCAGYALLFLMLFIITNKVFSPQYLLWLLPLVVLVPWEGKARRGFLWTFVLICVLTTVAFPVLFMNDLVAEGSAQLPVALWKFNTPSARLTIILVLRNVLFVVLTASLAGYLLRSMKGVRAVSR